MSDVDSENCVIYGLCVICGMISHIESQLAMDLRNRVLMVRSPAGRVLPNISRIFVKEFGKTAESYLWKVAP